MSVKEKDRTSIRVSRATRQRLNRAAQRKSWRRKAPVSLDKHLNELQDLEDRAGRRR
jgi:hypothetical protein